MGSAFDRWEKDPFFSAAEEVQESADRMESTYRTWVHAKKDSTGAWNLDGLRRDLQTALGTTKWQLEEFGRAVRSTYTTSSSADDARDRHRDFILAIEGQIKKVEGSLNEVSVSQGKPPLPWVRLDEGERDELASFLYGSSFSSTNNTSGENHVKNQGVEKAPPDGDRSLPNECSRSSSHLVELGVVNGKDEKSQGHRRTASATADLGSWKIAVSDDDPLLHESSSLLHDPTPPRKIPSFSALLNTMESSITQMKWPKNGFKKLKISDSLQKTDPMLPRSQNLTRGMHICYEKSKSCLNSCDECYDKQLYGWYGALQRQVQRSQYVLQYSRPFQIAFAIVLILLLLVLLVVCIN